MIQYCTFYLGPDLMGVDILTVQEITRGQEITPVPQADAFVKGLINLRGQIVPAVSLRALFGREDFPIGSSPINIILAQQGELLSLMADRAGDVAEFDAESLVAPPNALSDPGSRLIKGVHKLPDRLLHVLEPSAIWSDDPAFATPNHPGAAARQEAP